MIALDVMDAPAIAVAVLAVLGVLGRLLFGVYRFAKNLDDAVTYIRHEMELNSGRTMRDAINRIERKVDELETGRLVAIEEQLAGVIDQGGDDG